ncbi:hypothetical protein [Nocardioides zeae]|uniref:Uncharacterized protein n=1 Tax=Nocardioides zeae TaxID=1457234 RepID=A0A6P0HFS8_9ACTN|nr:hypothetical protein [Nocardioides zeae]NEN77441.1 hypothetical protein [Nocardioides zeae]
MTRPDDGWRSPRADRLPARATSVPAPPRTTVGAVNDHIESHLPRALSAFRAEADRLPPFASGLPGAPRRQLDPVAEVLRRTDDRELHALAAAVRRGEADERELRRHPVFVRTMRQVTAERLAAYEGLEVPTPPYQAPPPHRRPR